MKNRRNSLFCLSAFSLSLLLIINPLGISRLTVKKVNAQPKPRPYVVFVNGQGNCCTWGMTALQERLERDLEITRNDMRFVPYSNFRDGGQSGGGNRSDWSSVDTQFLRDGADFINNQLDRNRPLILIGHSFGGDSILSLILRINRRIQFVAVIDPVAAGALRGPIVQNRPVPSKVEYFFNRWQENYPWPIDFKRSGQVFSCEASSQGRRNCDQDSQNIARNADSSPITQECGWLETTCPGYLAPNPFRRDHPGGRKGTKQVRVGHQELPQDAYLQQTLGDKIIAQSGSWVSVGEVHNPVTATIDPNSRPTEFDRCMKRTGNSSFCLNGRNPNLVEIQGSLGAGFPTLNDGRLYKEHSFTGPAGEQVTITLSSSEFDTYLILLDSQGNKIGENNDARRETTDSQLTITLPNSGTYRILVKANNSTGRGQYTLSILDGTRLLFD